ncbi:hypothetical protein A9K55_004417 [Cordyceps militaris]|uniref:Cyclin n=1 Tax=Cordyceps militaris TaxID=73501 RepID=A0A2H4SN13_CORMI|nr:hypothetical protein A9K55_004417 [Cordyceps militaris]
MRKSKGGAAAAAVEHNLQDTTSYFTYRPLSNLPTPPSSSRSRQHQHHHQQPRNTGASYATDDGEVLRAIYRGKANSLLALQMPSSYSLVFSTGPAIHLVNLIPSSASLASASVHLVQYILGRANIPLETIALAVCILDRVDAKFGRKWRLTCPLCPGTEPTAAAAAAAASDETTQRQVSAHAKRHSLPVTPQPTSRHRPPQLHIDSVQPEIIVLAALVIADKFTDDAEQSTQSYCATWGRGLWSPAQLNATERSLMESLDYRIMPLCDDDCLADAMVDMQLAARHHGGRWDAVEPSPPRSDDGDVVFAGHDSDRRDTGNFVAGHARSKTLVPASGAGMTTGSVGLGLSWTAAI